MKLWQYAIAAFVVLALISSMIVWLAFLVSDRRAPETPATTGWEYRVHGDWPSLYRYCVGPHAYMTTTDGNALMRDFDGDGACAPRAEPSYPSPYR